MKNNLKKNTKIKLISFLSAVVLWMYVMAIVDPEDTKLFEKSYKSRICSIIEEYGELELDLSALDKKEKEKAILE